MAADHERAGFKTPQEEYWLGEFGTNYVGRNRGAALIASNVALFSQALRCTRQIRSCIELGANVGLNLLALRVLYPELQPHAIEINGRAAQELEGIVPHDNIHVTSILDFVPKQTYDLVLAKGALIHINPDYLSTVYEKLYRSCERYLLICEYYNPTPISVSYRGHTDQLFKRDFAGELLDQYVGLDLIDYGFAYHRDPNFPQDDVNWFLLRKRETTT
jgi:spore coat polysaccharide biosynthesis protein SpsF